jgi:hypothetical protein
MVQIEIPPQDSVEVSYSVYRLGHSKVGMGEHEIHMRCSFWLCEELALDIYMEQNTSWDANSRSAGRDNPHFYGTRRFIAVSSHSAQVLIRTRGPM